MDSSVSPKEEIWFLRVCHHISKAVYRRLSFHDICLTFPTLLTEQKANISPFSTEAKLVTGKKTHVLGTDVSI
jgi:hypothetical protein